MLLACLALAAGACLLGLLAPPPAGSHEALGQQAMDLVRAFATADLAVVLLLGPGIVLRAASGREVGLGFLPLPGLALLVAGGGLAWVLADSVDPATTCFAVVGTILGLLLGGLLGAGPEDLIAPEERWALGLVSLAFGLTVARTLWSLGPVGELYEGTISRTFVPEGRPDSRTSYLVTEMVAHGEPPYGPVGGLLFAPYNFSSRGPFPGMASAPIVLATGGKPPLGAPETPWQPFDHEGFMAFRIAMIAFSCTCFLSLWELVRRIGGTRAARLALLLAAGTPFLYSDLWFTWPKLLAASFVLLAGLCVVERHGFRAGLLISGGYMMHPSALIGLFGIGLLALWPIRGARLFRPQVLVAAGLAAGTAVGVYLWRVYNGVHYIQNGFYEYVKQAYPHYDPTPWQWIVFRANSLGDTLVPLFLPLVNGHSVSINELFGTSPGVVHFFFQPWTGVPFGLGIFFFPLLLISLWRAARRWPWAVVASIAIPFVAFVVYWGASVTGVLREGMQAWVLAVIAVVALQQAAAGFSWLRSAPVRVVLLLRVVEVFAVCVGATLGTHGFSALGDGFQLSDAVAFALIVAFAALIGLVTWSEGLGTRAMTPRTPGPPAR